MYVHQWADPCVCVCVYVCHHLATKVFILTKNTNYSRFFGLVNVNSFKFHNVLYSCMIFVVSLYLSVPTVNSVSPSGLSITYASSGGPATTVTWRRNCVVLPNNATYQQTQTVDVTQTTTYQNVLVIDSTVTDRDGVYTCSVTNTRGYDSRVTGMGGKY